MSIEMTQDTLDWIMEQLEQNRYKTELLENKIRKNVFTQLEQHTHRIDLLRNDSTIENRRVNLAHEKIESLENRIVQLESKVEDLEKSIEFWNKELCDRLKNIENKTKNNIESIVKLTMNNDAIEFVIQKIQEEILELESTRDAHDERLSELESHTTVDSDYVVRGKIQELEGHFNLLESAIKAFKNLAYDKFDKLDGKVDDLETWMRGQTETQFNLEEKYRTLLSNDKSQYSRDEKLREWIKHLENKISCDINKYAESLNDNSDAATEFPEVDNEQSKEKFLEHLAKLSQDLNDKYDGGPKWRDDLNFGQALNLLIEGTVKKISCWPNDYVYLSPNGISLLIYQFNSREQRDFIPNRILMLKEKWRVIE